MTETTTPVPQSTPHMDVRRSESGWTVTADLPGARREDLEVLLEEDVLTLTAPIRKQAPRATAGSTVSWPRASGSARSACPARPTRMRSRRAWRTAS